jgi:hypothetical protein
VSFPGQESASPDKSLKPLFDWLVKYPAYFSLADENYALRIEYVRVTGDRPGGAALLRRPRSRIERDLAAFLARSEGENMTGP